MPTLTNRLKLACRLAQLKAKLLGTDENGYGKCCSCGLVKAWYELHGGHFQPKGRHYNGACLDERNVNVQCSTCNTYMQGNPARYDKFMREEYGEDIFEELFLLSKQKTTKEQAEQFIIECRAECKELAKDKNWKVRVP